MCVLFWKQPRTGEPLLAERYIANPQYSSAYNVPLNTKGPTVPLLQKNLLTFIEEIGEGCFGKVYKGNEIIIRWLFIDFFLRI